MDAYRFIAITLAVRFASADPEAARKMADRIESEGEAGQHIAAILREDADFTEGIADKPAPLKMASGF